MLYDVQVTVEIEESGNSYSMFMQVDKNYLRFLVEDIGKRHYNGFTGNHFCYSAIIIYP